MGHPLQRIIDIEEKVKNIAINVLWYKDFVESIGTDNEDWRPAIEEAINYAVNNGYSRIYIPSGIYIVEPNQNNLESWENTPVVFKLPDYDLTIEGDGESTILKKGKKNVNALAMFRTHFGGTSKTVIKNLKIQGVGNVGANGNLADGICINGSSNCTIENVSIDKTKRHGIYLIHNANNNTIINPKITNANREMSGCAIQFEGASYNNVYNVSIENAGANGIDFNDWFGGSAYYPSNNGGNGSPYSGSQSYFSQYNKIYGGYIDGVGINNQSDGGGGSTNNPDDDYYCVNLINSSHHNEVFLHSLSNIRISALPNNYASAIRIWGAQNNAIKINKVYNSSNAVLKIDGNSQNNSIKIDDVDTYKSMLLYSGNGKVYNNDIKINDKNGSYTIDEKSRKGYSFKYIQAPNGLDGIVSSWQGNWGLTYTPVTNGLRITVDTSVYKSLSRNINFNYPFVVLRFNYKTNATNACVGLAEAPWYAVSGDSFIPDSGSHKMSLIIPYTDGQQSIMISPNNTATSANGAYIELSDMQLLNHKGELLSKPDEVGYLVDAPTIGSYNIGDKIYLTSPTSGGYEAKINTSTGWKGVGLIQ